jgi:hypothetical protein
MADLSKLVLPRKVVEEKTAEGNVSGSYIKLTGATRDRFKALCKALGYEGERGIKDVGNAVAEFGMTLMESKLAEEAEAANAKAAVEEKTKK